MSHKQCVYFWLTRSSQNRTIHIYVKSILYPVAIIGSTVRHTKLRASLNEHVSISACVPAKRSPWISCRQWYELQSSFCHFWVLRRPVERVVESKNETQLMKKSTCIVTSFIMINRSIDNTLNVASSKQCKTKKCVTIKTKAKSPISAL